MYRRTGFHLRKIALREADLREFSFASTLGANAEILKERAKCSTFIPAISPNATTPRMLIGAVVHKWVIS
jgi:hypothetical protein